MMVDVKYYDHKNGGYRTIKGMVAEIDFVYKILTIVDNKIAIKDIFDINGEEITEFDDFLNDQEKIVKSNNLAIKYKMLYNMQE